MLQAFAADRLSCEIVVCENGSTDETLSVSRKFERAHPQIRVEQIAVPNYGLALKHAIECCTNDTVVVFNIDFWSMEFVRKALGQLEHAEMVLASKVMPGADDQRPLIRRVITRGFNGFLRLVFGFKGSDTHGMKAFKRVSLLPILSACVTDHFILDTELVIRAERLGLRIAEIPVRVREYRQPSYRTIIRRIPNVVWNLGSLWFALRSSRQR